VERFLLAAGELVLRVGTRMTARERSTARAYGKSDSIDALAVARAGREDTRRSLAQRLGRYRRHRLSRLGGTSETPARVQRGGHGAVRRPRSPK
jgi:hypothetical protein